jgi:hypothetical protein
MHCPLCGAENPQNAKRCHLCDTAVETNSNEVNETLVVETVDVSQKIVSWQKLAIVLATIAVVVAPWTFMLDLFTVPDEVQEARENFTRLETSYLENGDQWDQQKNQILLSIRRHESSDDITKPELTFDHLPLEVVLSYLHDDLDWTQDVAFFPHRDLASPTLIISKYEPGVWPLKIILSLELRLKEKGHHVWVEIGRLRRGKREISNTLIWTYFGQELRQLRRLETFGGGIENVRLSQAEETKRPQISWTYWHRALRSPGGLAHIVP